MDDLLADRMTLPDQGYFLPSRLGTGLPADAPLVADEQFGPILPIVS